jgi:hypothetical protein
MSHVAHLTRSHAEPGPKGTPYSRFGEPGSGVSKACKIRDCTRETVYLVGRFRSSLTYYWPKLPLPNGVPSGPGSETLPHTEPRPLGSGRGGCKIRDLNSETMYLVRIAC